MEGWDTGFDVEAGDKLLTVLKTIWTLDICGYSVILFFALLNTVRFLFMQKKWTTFVLTAHYAFTVLVCLFRIETFRSAVYYTNPEERRPISLFEFMAFYAFIAIGVFQVATILQLWITMKEAMRIITPEQGRCETYCLYIWSCITALVALSLCSF